MFKNMNEGNEDPHAKALLRYEHQSWYSIVRIEKDFRNQMTAVYNKYSNLPGSSGSQGKVCSSADTCPECVDWSDIQWLRYGTKKRKSAKRSPRKVSVSSPIPSPSERSDGVSVSPSPTQSRGRGKSSVGDEQGVLSQEPSVSAEPVAGPSWASEGPSSAPGESALVFGGHASSDDPVWGNNAVSVSPPPSWACASGSSLGGDSRSKIQPASHDVYGWRLPKTPGRSPLRMDVDLDPWLPDMERLDSFPTLPTEVPDDFLQASTSGIHRPKKSPTVPASSRHVVDAVSSGFSDIYSSSEEEVKVKHRRRRERSRTERSRSKSRSSYSKKQSRSPSRKYRMSVSPGGAWVYVSSRESKALRSPDHRSNEQSPRQPPSKHGLDPRDLARRKDLSVRHKSLRPPVYPAQRGETRFFTGSQAEPAQLVRPSGRKERFPLSGQPPGTAPSAPRAFGRTRVPAVPAVPTRSRAPGPVLPADEVQYLGRTAPLAPRVRRPVGVPGNPASPPQAEASADEGEGSPTEDSAYRRVVSLIRRHHGIAEPTATGGDSWRSSLLRIMQTPSQPKSSLALPLARDLGLKNQGKVYLPEGRHPGPCKVATAVDILGQGVSDDRASSAPVCFSPAEASMMEEMSRDLINVSSWLDWWASTLVGVQASYDPEDPDQQSLMRELLISGGKTLKFLSYQSLALTANWVLRKRDTVLAKVSRKVPDREVRAIRSLPLWGESLFPVKELEALMEKVSKRKENNVTKPAALRRPPYKRSVSDSAATPQASSSTTRREAPSSSWSSTPQPSRRGTSAPSGSFRSGYSASRRGRSGRSSRRRESFPFGGQDQEPQAHYQALPIGTAKESERLAEDDRPPGLVGETSPTGEDKAQIHPMESQEPLVPDTLTTNASSGPSRHKTLPGMVMTLVAPWWPEREWFLDLKDPMSHPPWPLPARSDLLQQPNFLKFPDNPLSLRLHAWRLSSGS
ncbi:serine/arginine repetitive matrix protein 2-like [Palaemon carinicauda]|uniref:serine/arginine repetitive matrix protein 2-like n=1 Tax=Palaemon carinicauda TaxID=392227 RepID=UPI0035B605F2